jgi:hypothetical protein
MLLQRRTEGGGVMTQDEQIANLESEVKTLRVCLERQAFNMRLRNDRIKELEAEVKSCQGS